MPIYFGQDIATKLSQADDYFATDNHIQAYDWAEYSDTEKKAALTQSERELDAHMGLCLELNYSTTSFPIIENSSFRPDYAVMEHAFFLLDNTARVSADSGGVKRIESDRYQREERTTGVVISPKALVFLRAQVRKIARA